MAETGSARRASSRNIGGRDAGVPPGTGPTPPPQGRRAAGSPGAGAGRLLYVDMAYTLRIVRGRHHEDYWHARHSGDYFPLIWGIHPIADVPDGEVRRRTRVSKFSTRQLIIEGTSQALPLPQWLLPFNFLLSQLALFRAIVRRARRRGAAAVFSNDPLYAGLFGLFLARRLKVPLIVFVPAHYDELYEANGELANRRIFRFRRVEQAVMRFVFSNTDMVFAAADSLAALALKYGARPDTVERLSHGKYLAAVHLSDPASREPADDVLHRLKIPSGKEYLIFVGRQTGIKHPEDALLAMSVAMKADPEVVGIMAGEGDLAGRLRDQARELGIADRVAFPGLIDQPSLSRLLPHCVTLSPLTGMALIEAALAGSPVVAYDRDWQSEFVIDGVNGELVAYRDWQSMGEKALAILRDRKKRLRYSLANRERALAFVDLEGNRAKEHAAFDRMFERWRQGTTQARKKRR